MCLQSKKRNYNLLPGCFGDFHRTARGRSVCAAGVLFLISAGILVFTAGCQSRQERFLAGYTGAAGISSGPGEQDFEGSDPEEQDFEAQDSEEQDFEVQDLGEQDLEESGNASADAAAITEAAAVPARIYIDVCGAVRHPGVYVLPEGSRIFEAIQAAGGFSEEAARESVNQAGFLHDEFQLYIPTREEFESGGGMPVSDKDNIRSGGEELTDGSRINLNTAGAEQLISLPGIGETRAADILAYREQHGSFGSVEELMQVKGIKEGTFVKIRDRITVD